MKKLFLSESLPKKDSGRKQICRVMKLTASFLLLCSCFAFAGHANSQNAKVSLNKTKVQLQDILSEIENQTDYLFVSNRNVDLKQKVSVRATDRPVQEVLDEILKNTGLTFTIEGVNIILSEVKLVLDSTASQQERKIEGKIIDVNGEPIIGANIVEKGTTNGVISDLQGSFSLNVTPGVTLVISYIGYVSQELKIGNQISYNITLREDSETLDEVVVIGYGTVKKSDLTGSVSSIKSGELAAIPQASAAQALQGRTAGVYVKQNSGAPGSTTTVRIRGTNSILGGNDPLYVIDGFPSNVGMGMLNVDDIESMEVLKDASAIAIYGSRGSNGVILITTKKGRTGKTKVEFGTTIGFQSLAKKMDLMNAREYAEFYNIRAKNDGQEPFFTQDQIDAFGNGFDWQDFVFTTAPIRTHSLTVSGGSEKTKFVLAGNIFDKEGIVGKGGYDRYTLRANFDHDISKRVKVNFTTTLSRSISDNKDSSGGRQGNSLTSVALVAPPVVTPYNEDGSYRILENAYPVITTGGAVVNPLNMLNEIKDITKRNRILSNLSITYEPIDGLFIKVSGGVENSDVRGDYYKTRKYYNSTGYASVSTSQEISLLNENTVSYIKTFAEKHNLSLMGGFTYQDYTYKKLDGNGTGFLSDITETGNLGSAAVPGISSSGYSKWVLLSSIARLNYNFDRRYLFTFSFRADGSSRYSDGDKWGVFSFRSYSMENE